MAYAHTKPCPSPCVPTSLLHSSRATVSGDVCWKVLDRYYDRGTVILGKVENGSLTKGEKLMLVPTGTVCTVESLCSDETPVKQARPGDNVAIRVSLNVEDICKGFVICSGAPAKAPEAAIAVTQIVCFLCVRSTPHITFFFP